MARFETWRIDGQSPQKLNDISLCLDSKEVELHVAESLKQRRVWGLKGPRSVRHVKSSVIWSLPFPAAIGADLNLVVVLRTAYVVCKRSNPDELSSATRGSALRIVQLDDQGLNGITFQGTDTSHPRSSPTPSADKTAGSSVPSIKMAHTYSYQVSGNCQHILRRDSRTLLCGGVNDPVTHALMVFALDPNQGASTVLSFYRTYDLATSINGCELHPRLALAIFYTRSLRNGLNVLLWFFGGDFKDKAFLDDLTGEVLSNASRGVERLQFSACGNQIIVQEMGSAFPVVISIESTSAYQHAIRSSHELAKASATSSHITVDEDDARITSVALRGESFTSNQLVWAGTSFSQAEVSLRGSKRTVQLTAVSDNGTTREIQNLVSVPDSWDSVDTETGLSIRVVSVGENH